MPPGNPRRFDIVRHRARGVRAPYLLVLQHHDIPSATRIVAPLTLPGPGDHDAIAPRVIVDGDEYRARLLDMAAVPRPLLLETVASAAAEADAITYAMDVIFGGYPVGRPH
jgi:hypothetical protein